MAERNTKRKPLLYERVSHVNQFINETMPFVIDKESLIKCWNLAPLPMLPQLAVLPFKQTWIELDLGKLGALCTGTTDTLIMSFFDGVDVPVPIIVMIFRDGERKAESGFIEELCAKVDVRIFPEAVTHGLVTQILGAEDVPYRDSISVCTFENTDEAWPDSRKIHHILQWATQYKGIATAVMAVMAAMAYGPAKKTEMAPAGRWLAKTRHGYASKPFRRHTVVKIEMAEKLLHRTLRNRGEEEERARRAEHDVRSHPRVIRRGRPDEYTVIVQAHKRGDPAIGRIIHDAYETTRTERR